MVEIELRHGGLEGSLLWVPAPMVVKPLAVKACFFVRGGLTVG
jgi:hypothetical protein